MGRKRIFSGLMSLRSHVNQQLKHTQPNHRNWGRLMRLPMNNAHLFVQIFERLCNLYDDMSREFFAKVGQADNLVEQFTTGCKLQYNVIILPRLKEINQSNDIGMIELAHDLHFL